MKITRIYDDNGQSRFADIEIPLNPSDSPASRFASAPFDAEQCFFFSAPPHVRPQRNAQRRQLVVVLSGEQEVETSDGEKRRFRPGDVVLADDTTGSGHITRALTEVTILFVPVADIPV